MKVLSLNVNSFVGHLAQLLQLVNNLKPQIVVLVETWLQPTIDNSIIAIEGYQIFRKDRNLLNSITSRYLRGNGVACLVHDSLKAKMLQTSISDDINATEFLIMDIITNLGSHLLLSCIYRRPNGHTLSNFFNMHSKLVPNLKNSIIADDLNCN